ncbi:MAG: PGPGW domain-containing protein [Candidatus Methylomirabilales bacterium]
MVARSFWKATRLILGWGLIVLGIVGLFLPLLQGIAFIVAGLALLSRDSPWARRWLERVKGWLKRKGGAI